MRALLRGAHVHGAVRLWSRHVTPRAFTHLVVTGADGRALLNGIVPTASGLFVFGHPTLGLWSKLEDEYKRPDGGPLHQFAGVTPDKPADPCDTKEDLGVGDVRLVLATTAAEKFAGQATVELYLPGHIERVANGVARGGTPLVALEADAELLAALLPGAVAWREDTTLASAAPSGCKGADGKLRVDPAVARTTATVSWADPAALPVIP